MTPKRAFLLETLEDRTTPAAFGNPWPDAAHLTVSFMPDGTDLGGQSSRLFQALDALAPRAVWQTDILRAVQAWASTSGVNVGLVDDQGQAFGIGGKPQSDPRFGDIRVGGGHYGPDVLAFASPFDITAGTACGDIRINLDAFTAATRPDLYTVVLQEFGHALGIDNSPDPASVMFEDYLRPRAGLSAGDAASVQALYGARPADAYEGASGNSTNDTAFRLGLFANSGGVLALRVTGDLARGDIDTYRFTAPSLTGSFRVLLQRDGYSLVTPRVTLMDSSGKVVATAVSTNPDGGDLELRVSTFLPLATYFLRVESAAGTFSVGGYTAHIEAIPLLNGLLGGLTGTVVGLGETLTNNDLHTNDTPLTALNLFGGTFTSPSRFDAAYQGSISDGWDKDYYRVVAPSSGSVMQVMAWGTGKSAVLPKLSVLDAQGNAVAAEVIVNESGTVCVQVRGVVAGATYFIGIESAATGNYFLGVDFTDRAVNLTTFADNTLDETTPTRISTMKVNRAGLFHFVLAGEVKLTITDTNGAVVWTLTSDGTAISMTLTLNPGTYRFTFATTRTDGKTVRYILKGALLSDPIGPQAEDPTAEPSKTPAPTSDPEPTSDTTYSWYYWYEDPDSTSTYGGPKPEDPYGTGYGA